MSNCLYASLINNIYEECKCSPPFAIRTNKASLDSTQNDQNICAGVGLGMLLHFVILKYNWYLEMIQP